jgi:hypothetical protein
VSLPVLKLAGAPYEQRLQHGRDLRDRVGNPWNRPGGEADQSIPGKQKPRNALR